MTADVERLIEFPGELGICGAGDGNRTRMTSLEDRFWLTVICAVHQTRWSVARLFSGVSLRICPCFLLLAHRWPEAYQASGTQRARSGLRTAQPDEPVAELTRQGARGRGGYGPRTQPRTNLAMPDVVWRLVERRTPQLVMAASAGDQEMTHAPALRRRGGFPC